CQGILTHRPLEATARVASALLGGAPQFAGTLLALVRELASALRRGVRFLTDGLAHRIGAVYQPAAKAGGPVRLTPLGSRISETRPTVARHCSLATSPHREEPDGAQGDGRHR